MGGTRQRTFQGMQTPSWQGSGGRGVNPKLSVGGGHFLCVIHMNTTGKLEDGIRGEGVYILWVGSNGRWTYTELLYPQESPHNFCKGDNVDSPDTLLDTIWAERHHRLARSAHENCC